MAHPSVQPWIPPAHPDLARLAMAAADAAGIGELRAWPEHRKGGIGFGNLPPFASWRGEWNGQHHLVLFQAREAGALVPGARMAPLPEGWLESLDLDALARPLAAHPDFPGGASIHVIHLPGGDRVRVRSQGEAAPEVIAAVLDRVVSPRPWLVV